MKNVKTTKKHQSKTSPLVSHVEKGKLRAEGQATFERFNQWSNDYQYSGLPYFVRDSLAALDKTTPTDILFYEELHRQFMSAYACGTRFVKFNKHVAIERLNISERTVWNSIGRLRGIEAIRFVKTPSCEEADWFVLNHAFFEAAEKAAGKRKKPIKLPVKRAPAKPSGATRGDCEQKATKDQAHREEALREAKRHDDEALRLLNERIAKWKAREEVSLAEAKAAQALYTSPETSSAQTRKMYFEAQGSSEFAAKQIYALMAKIENYEPTVKKLQKQFNEEANSNVIPIDSNVSEKERRKQIGRAHALVDWLVNNGVAITSKEETAYSLFEWATEGWGRHKAKDFNHALNIGGNLIKDGKFTYTLKGEKGAETPTAKFA